MKNTQLPDSARHFDALAASARIDIAAMVAITGKSRATIYRWVERGILPKPRKLAGTQNTWSVGEVRRALSA